MAETQKTDDANQPLSQFQLKHLVGLLTGAAILLAIVGPLFRRLDPATQWVASVKTLLAMSLALGIMIYEILAAHVAT